MAVTIFAHTCIEFDTGPRLAHKAAPYVDIAIGLALVIIAVLGTQSILPISNHVSYSLLGLGSAYAGMAILVELSKCKTRMNCSKKFYLIEAPKVEAQEYAGFTSIS